METTTGRLSEQQREDVRIRYAAVDSANVADVLDELGYPDQGLDSSLKPVTGTRIGGWAYTIAGQMMPYSGTGDPLKMQACHGIGVGEIAVWSGNGEGVCYFGELIVLGLREQGCSGILADGGVRDVRAIREHGFPVFAAYTSSVQSIGRWKVSAFQLDISLPGATIRNVAVAPGDFILGDEDGVIVIPSAIALEVLERSEEITTVESNVRDAISAGMTLTDALSKFGHV